MYQEKRRTPRISFVAVAEVTDEGSGGQLTGQVSELSAYGCYVDILNPLPVANTVIVKIFAASRCFEAKANVIYAQQYLGGTRVSGNLVAKREFAAAVVVGKCSRKAD